MDAASIMTAITMILNAGFSLWEKARQVYGQDAIPEWDDISGKNARLQAKIDAEKE